MFQEIYTTPMVGSYAYFDSATTTTPISMPTPGEWYPLTNDKSVVLDTYAAAGVTNLWDSENDQVDLSELALGDQTNVVADVTVTTTTNNQQVNMRIDYGIGGPAPGHVHMMPVTQIKSIGTYEMTGHVQASMSNAAIRDYPAQVVMMSDAAMTVVVESIRFHVRRYTLDGSV